MHDADEVESVRRSTIWRLRRMIPETMAVMSEEGRMFCAHQDWNCHFASMGALQYKLLTRPRLFGHNASFDGVTVIEIVDFVEEGMTWPGSGICQSNGSRLICEGGRRNIERETENILSWMTARFKGPTSWLYLNIEPEVSISSVNRSSRDSGDP